MQRVFSPVSSFLTACAFIAIPLFSASDAIAAQQVAATAQFRQVVANAPSIERFMKIRAPNSPTVAPNGALYVRDWPDGVNQLYRRGAGTDLKTPMQRLTNFEDGLNAYTLSPDGKHIILAAASGGSEQDDLHHLDPATGEITPLFTNQNVVYTFQVWLHDSSGFIFTANEESRSDFHIYRYDLATKERTKLLSRPGYWTASDITRDGQRLLVGQYISASHADAYELNVANGNLTKLNMADETYNAAAGYLSSEHSAAVISDVEEGIRRLFVRDLPIVRSLHREERKPYKPLAALDAYEVETWTSNNSRSYVAITVNEDGYSTLHVYMMPGFKPVQFPEIERGIVGSVGFEDVRLVWTLNNARTPGLAYKWTVGGGKPPTQLTAADEQGINLREFSLPKLIRYSSFDGVEIPAFLYTPPGYREGTAIPFVANYHGGPESQFRPVFSALIQYLLANGFGVIQPNVRGSTGYGREFHMMDNYRNRWDSVRDGAEAARWLVRNGYAEPGGIAAYGGSYGGFMSVATVIEAPDIFGASINVVGIVNFKTFLEQTRDYRRALREAEYGPLSDPEFLESISPIHRIDEIKVPMLIAHGLNDPRVPVGEAMQLAVGLQKRGYDPELLFFPDEGHGFAKLENRLLFAERMTKFLRRHIAK